MPAAPRPSRGRLQGVPNRAWGPGARGAVAGLEEAGGVSDFGPSAYPFAGGELFVTDQPTMRVGRGVIVFNPGITVELVEPPVGFLESQRAADFRLLLYGDVHVDLPRCRLLTLDAHVAVFQAQVDAEGSFGRYIFHSHDRDIPGPRA